jgi:drug/metabolite transporter (DMT)-like permease
MSIRPVDTGDAIMNGKSDVNSMRTYAAFAGAVVIGGANFVAVSLSNQELAPLYGAALRFALGAIIFLLIARVRRVPRARGRAAAGAAVYGVFGFGAAYALLYYSLVGLDAGTTAVIIGAVPLFTLVLAILLGQERVSVRGVLGALLALIGITVLSMGAIDGDVGGSYLVAAFFGSVAIAASSVVAKALPDVHPVNMNAIGMAAGTALLVLGSLALGERWAVPRESATVLAIAWLVVLGSVGLFQLFLFVIRQWTASASVYVVAAMPVVAVALGALILDQPVTVRVVVGGGIVMAAVYVGAISTKKDVPPPVAAAGPAVAARRATM